MFRTICSYRSPARAQPRKMALGSPHGAHSAATGKSPAGRSHWAWGDPTRGPPSRRGVVHPQPACLSFATPTRRHQPTRPRTGIGFASNAMFNTGGRWQRAPGREIAAAPTSWRSRAPRGVRRPRRDHPRRWGQRRDWNAEPFLGTSPPNTRRATWALAHSSWRIRGPSTARASLCRCWCLRFSDSSSA